MLCSGIGSRTQERIHRPGDCNSFNTCRRLSFLPILHCRQHVAVTVYTGFGAGAEDCSLCIDTHRSSGSTHCRRKADRRPIQDSDARLAEQAARSGILASQVRPHHRSAHHGLQLYQQHIQPCGRRGTREIGPLSSSQGYRIHSLPLSQGNAFLELNGHGKNIID